jgi:hypothetical protein
LYIASGADSGWGSNPSAEALTSASIIVAVPALQVVGLGLALANLNRWSYLAKLVCVTVPLLYLMALLVPVLER